MDSDRFASGAPSRVWPAFVVVVAAVALTIAAQIALAVLLTTYRAAGGGDLDPDAIRQMTEDFVLSPVGVIVMAGAGQLAFLACVWIASGRLRGSRTDQLGLARARLPRSTYAMLVLGTGVPAGVGVGLSSLLSLVVEPAVDVELIWSRITAVTFVPYVLFISLSPGFVEEITFRGFVQRRLLNRWKPATAIAWSSILFALAHLDLHHVAFALPIGIWFGIIAWRVGVIWPCIACHAVLNGLWSIYFIGAVKAGASTAFYVASTAVVGTLSLWGFARGLRILSGTPPAPIPATIDPS